MLLVVSLLLLIKEREREGKLKLAKFKSKLRKLKTERKGCYSTASLSVLSKTTTNLRGLELAEQTLASVPRHTVEPAQKTAVLSLLSRKLKEGSGLNREEGVFCELESRQNCF